MTDLVTALRDASAERAKPQITAAQKALLDRKVLALNSLAHGAYYNGLLDDLTTIARWHAQKRRFVFRDHTLGEAKVKAVPHVADLGTGARFAPLSVQEPDGEFQISEFALETTH